MKNNMGNPIHLAWRDEALAKLDALRDRNPFLADFLLESGMERNNPWKLGYQGIIAFIDLLEVTGLDERMTSPGEIDTHEPWFWDLAEAAKAIDDDGQRTRSALAVCTVYRDLYRHRIIGEHFREPPTSPALFLSKKEFRQLIVEEFIIREDVAVLTFSKDNNAQLVLVPCKNPIIREMVLDTFRNWPNQCDRTAASIILVREAETWFEGTTDEVLDYRDLTTTMLVTAKDHILKNWEDFEERKSRIRFLFLLFGRQALLHPEHAFFSDSIIWDSEMLLQPGLAIHLAHGYEIALYGQLTPFHQGVGTLFILNNADEYSASNPAKKIWKIDLSQITNPRLWDALANYLLHHSRTRQSFPRNFLRWIEEERQKDGGDPCHITKKDMDRYRVMISRMSVKGEARNARVNALRNFINYAAEEKLLNIDADALKHFAYFTPEYRPNPKPLNNSELQKLLVTLDELGTFNPRYALDRVAAGIISTQSIRIGQLLATRISHMHFYNDGTMETYSRMKNGGKDRVRYRLTNRNTTLICKAMEITEGFRAKCPAGTVEDQLFIFPGVSKTMMTATVLNVSMFNKDLKYACEVAGIRKISSGNLRDTYYTTFKHIADREGISKLAQAAATNHASLTSTRSYFQPDIVEMLEFTAQIEKDNI